MAHASTNTPPCPVGPAAAGAAATGLLQETAPKKRGPKVGSKRAQGGRAGAAPACGRRLWAAYGCPVAGAPAGGALAADPYAFHSEAPNGILHQSSGDRQVSAD